MHIMYKSKFQNNYVRAYTMGVSLWARSFEIVHHIHDGGWTLFDYDERPLDSWWDNNTLDDDDYWDMMDIFSRGGWK